MNKNLLFVCIANIQRSKTAEALFKKDKRFSVKSAGVSEYAENQVTKKILEWADHVFVMEPWHQNFIEKRFPKYKKKVVCLNIHDIYFFNDPKLIQNLQEKINAFFQ
ncbi:phosphotyrosine protein phosphatase [Candidatus Woesearchaeota archaeon]|nr:phosphotyrosine protein phosphatase [Candidatus Woesearchaeota archaeon]